METDRFVRTCGLLHSYASIRSERTLPYEPPSLLDVPLPETVDLYVGAVGEAEARLGKQPRQDGTSAKSPIPLLAATVDSIAASLCAHLELCEEDGEEGRVGGWQFFLHQAVVGERAKLRRRLSSILRFSAASLGELRAGVEELFGQLDGWLGERVRQEAEASGALCAMMRRAVEREEKLPHALQLEGDTLLVDEALLLLPPPPPPPVLPPTQLVEPGELSALQLGSLAAKLRLASSGESLQLETFARLMCKLSAAHFDASSPPLPNGWLPLTHAAYTRLGMQFCPQGSQLLGWPEVITKLAKLPPPTEAQVSEMLSAASALAAVDLTKKRLLLSREQMGQLNLWFETGKLQPDGYSVDAALKDVLFEMLARNGLLDLQRLLLYCAQSASVGFAILGGASEGMLSLEDLYDLLHREGDEPAEHSDPFCRPALRRLFTLLKLGEGERAPYSLVAAHPAGAALLAQCVSYTPKRTYELLQEELAAAGQALRL